MRSVAVAVALCAAACGSETNGGLDLGDHTADLAVSSSDIAMCIGGVTAPTTSTPCGIMTCAPGAICVVHVPGTGFPRFDLAMTSDGGADGGSTPYDPEFHSCVTLPADCQQCGGCAPLPFGCFSRICDQYEDRVGCHFDGANLECFNI